MATTVQLGGSYFVVRECSDLPYGTKVQIDARLDFIRSDYGIFNDECMVLDEEVRQAVVEITGELLVADISVTMLTMQQCANVIGEAIDGEEKEIDRFRFTDK